MKATILSAVLFFAIDAVGFTDPALLGLRAGLKKAEVSESDALRFYDQLLQTRPQTPMTEGYLAATEGLLAKHAFLPTTKYSRCKQSLERFSKAIAADPKNLELRYLRLAVETNLPGFLGMSGDVSTDRTVAMQMLPTCSDQWLRRGLARLLLEKGSCTSTETESLRKYLE